MDQPIIENIDWDKRRLLYKMLVYITMVMNFDTGVFPPAIKEI